MGGTSTDRELLDLAAGGDGDAWGALWQRHRRELFALAMSFVGDAPAAEDVVACAFERAHSALGRDFDGEHVGAWLCRITANCAIDELRWKASRQRALVALCCEPDDDDPDIRFAELVYERRSLAAALAMLAPSRRAVVHLRLQGLPWREVAAAMGCSEPAVKTRWQRALATLREIIGYHRELSAGEAPQPKALPKQRGDHP